MPYTAWFENNRNLFFIVLEAQSQYQDIGTLPDAALFAGS